MIVKLSDVAKRAGVSKATVSLALNGSDKVNINTRKRVLTLAQEMGYSPNPYAKRLVMRKSGLIGLVVPDIENVYYATLIRHISTALKSSGYGLFISMSDNSCSTEGRVVREMVNNRMEALFIVPVNKPNDDIGYIEWLRETEIPALFLTSMYTGVDMPCVMCDLYGGMKGLIHTIHSRGCRRIALISGPADVYCLDLRANGYRDALRDLSLTYERIARVERVDYQETLDLMRRTDFSEADTIVCVNDMMALGVINALREKGLHVPDDVAVAGYDDVIFSDISPIPITTVRQNLETISHHAVEKIMRMLRGEPVTGENWHDILPCEIVIKQSTP